MPITIVTEKDLQLPQIFNWIPEDFIKTADDYFYAIENFDHLLGDKVPEK
jgi:hypothetical protein